MDIKHIKELMKMLEDSELDKLVLKDENGCEIHLEKKSPEGHATHHYVAPTQQQQPTQAAPAPSQSEPTAPAKESGTFVTAPMVGTFYSSPSPDDPNFIKVGDKIDENTVVCIIEAMKVMNEVKAGVSGVVKEICVENAQAIEFGTKLFRVE